MRIGVIGAGAVGGVLAALLDRAGHDVTVTARGAQFDAIQADGLALDGAWGAHVARVRAVPVLVEKPELAILTTKAQDARSALEANRAVLDGVPLLIVQNGLGGVRMARELLPASPVVGGLALFAASYLSPGRVTVTAALPTLLGPAPGTPRAVAEEVAAVIADAVPVEVVDDLQAAQWSKLLVNHLNALPAITGMSVQETVAHPRLRRLLAASLRETVRIAARLRVRFANYQGVPGWALQLLGRLPLPFVGLFPRMLARRMGDVPNPGSTLQSIRRGQRTEIDFLNGAVVAAAAGAGLPAPVNAALVALVHEVEESHAFLDPADVVHRVRAQIAPRTGARRGAGVSGARPRESRRNAGTEGDGP